MLSFFILEKFIKYSEKELKKDSATSPNPQPQDLQSFILNMETAFADYLTGDCLRRVK